MQIPGQRESKDLNILQGTNGKTEAQEMKRNTQLLQADANIEQYLMIERQVKHAQLA